MRCRICKKEIKESEEHSVQGSTTAKDGRIFLHYVHWDCVKNLKQG